MITADNNTGLNYKDSF